MEFSQPEASLFVPDNVPMPDALQRTTHLCVGAHQDDQEFMAYDGIVECFSRPDKWFTGVIVTNGGGSSRSGPYADYSDEQMMHVRWQEQRKAAYVGEYACQIQLVHPSAFIKDPHNAAVIEDLRQVFAVALPEVVYCHNPADKHDTHVASALRVIAAMRTLPAEQRPRQVIGCEIWRSLDWLNDDDKYVMNVDRHRNLTAALSGVFDSQITGGKRYDAANIGRQTANATFFESHATDTSGALSWGMDLTPLVQDDTLDVAEYTLAFIERFKSDVVARIGKFSG